MQKFISWLARPFLKEVLNFLENIIIEVQNIMSELKDAEAALLAKLDKIDEVTTATGQAVAGEVSQLNQVIASLEATAGNGEQVDPEDIQTLKDAAARLDAQATAIGNIYQAQTGTVGNAPTTPTDSGSTGSAGDATPSTSSEDNSGNS